jgi:hypothetical protein
MAPNAAAERVIAAVSRLLGSDVRTVRQRGRPDVGRRPVPAAPGAGRAGKRTSARSQREGGEGLFAKVTAIGTVLLCDADLSAALLRRQLDILRTQQVALLLCFRASRA